MTLENDIRMDRLDKTKEAATKVNESLDWPNLIKFRKENDEIRKTGLKVKIVFMGDSITEGLVIK